MPLFVPWLPSWTHSSLLACIVTFSCFHSSQLLKIFSKEHCCHGNNFLHVLIVRYIDVRLFQENFLQIFSLLCYLHIKIFIFEMHHCQTCKQHTMYKLLQFVAYYNLHLLLFIKFWGSVFYSIKQIVACTLCLIMLKFSAQKLVFQIYLYMCCGMKTVLYILYNFRVQHHMKRTRTFVSIS